MENTEESIFDKLGMSEDEVAKGTPPLMPTEEDFRELRVINGVIDKVEDQMFERWKNALTKKDWYKALMPIRGQTVFETSQKTKCPNCGEAFYYVNDENRNPETPTVKVSDERWPEK